MMTSKREVTMGLVFGVAALAAMRAGGCAAMAATEAEALEALNPWADALFSGDPAQVEKVLAPEYQILRSDGAGYLKADYLNALPKQKIRSRFRNIVARASALSRSMISNPRPTTACALLCRRRPRHSWLTAWRPISKRGTGTVVRAGSRWVGRSRWP